MFPERTEKALKRNLQVLRLDESLFLVESYSAKADLVDTEWYTVDLDEWTCECGDYQSRGNMCYHIRTVLIKKHHGEIEEV